MARCLMAAMTVMFGVWLAAGCSDDDSDTAGGIGGSGAKSNTGGKGSTGGGSGENGGTDAGGQGQSGDGGQAGSKPSDPCADCAGCCDGSTCLPLASQNKLSCGKTGAKCSTCDDGETCEAGACVVDPSVCSPLSCPDGCCAGNKCFKELSWDSCSTGGAACVYCEPMALCTEQAKCSNSQWGPDALIDLYIDEYSVSEAQCSDPVGAPDPYMTVTVGTKSYTLKCDDQYTCSTGWVIPKIPYGQFQLGQVKFSIDDDDSAIGDPCWSGKFPIPPRNFEPKILKPGDGTVTYRVRPAGF